jgi:hypothetical protein
MNRKLSHSQVCCNAITLSEPTYSCINFKTGPKHKKATAATHTDSDFGPGAKITSICTKKGFCTLNSAFPHTIMSNSKFSELPAAICFSKLSVSVSGSSWLHYDSKFESTCFCINCLISRSLPLCTFLPC